MRAHKPQPSAINLEELRAARDQELSLDYFRNRGERGIVPRLMAKYRIPRRTVYNVIERMREWALAQLEEGAA